MFNIVGNLGLHKTNHQRYKLQKVFYLPVTKRVWLMPLPRKMQGDLQTKNLLTVQKKKKTKRVHLVSEYSQIGLMELNTSKQHFKRILIKSNKSKIILIVFYICIALIFLSSKLGVQKFRMGLKKKNDQNKSDDRNPSLITPQERGMSSGEISNELYRGLNVQFPTHHVNNIPQPSYFQQHNTNLNLMTQRVSSPPGNHYDRLSVASSSRNLVTTHQHHTSHQIPEFPCNDQSIEERLVYYEEDEDDGVKNLITDWFTQIPDQINLFPLEESVITTTMRFNDIQVSANQQEPMYVHEPSMMHIPSLPSSHTHNPFLDQVTTAYISQNSHYSLIDIMQIHRSLVLFCVCTERKYTIGGFTSTTIIP